MTFWSILQFVPMVFILCLFGLAMYVDEQMKYTQRKQKETREPLESVET